LYRVAVRQAVNFHRKNNRRSNAKPLPDLEVTSTAQQPLDWILAKEETQHFQSAFARLSAAQREILTLKYGEKWSYQQLADHLGIPVRSVEYRLLQARDDLRRLLIRSK
jgi:RNA polymerase sigma-70 factor (ECF subfamily)